MGGMYEGAAMAYRVELLMTEFVTHDVKRFIVTRPPGFEVHPGQGVDLAIDAPEWREQTRPFTPTSLREDRVLEFTIKRYPDHHGVTDALHRLEPGAHLLISDPWGSIHYAGPGVFIAGGAGITPFIAILRRLARDDQLEGCSLLFSNKTPADIICAAEFRHYLGERCTFLCTRAAAPGCEARRIDKDLLREKIDDFSRRFYTCGPKKFVREINAALVELGANPETIVFEK